MVTLEFLKLVADNELDQLFAQYGHVQFKISGFINTVAIRVFPALDLLVVERLFGVRTCVLKTWNAVDYVNGDAKRSTWFWIASSNGVLMQPFSL